MTHSLTSWLISLAIAMILSQPIISNAQKTHLKPLLNEVNSNFNYGKSNSALQPYKKDLKGLLVGASFQGGITNRFSLVTEAYYTMKGATLKSGNPLTLNESTIRLHAAEIPVLMRVHLGRFYFNAGPYVGYTFSGKLKVEGSESMDSKKSNIEFDNSHQGFKRWDYGLQAGAGYNFRIKNKELILDLRYGYGLNNMSNHQERFNRTFNISIIAVKTWQNNPLSKNKY